MFSNKVSATIRDARCNYEKRIAALKDVKCFYKYVRSSLVGPVKTPHLRDVSGRVTEDSQLVANLFADTFAKVFTVDTNSNLPTVQTPPNSTTITSVEFSEVAIAKKISKLRITKSPGPDSITVSLLKKCQCLCQNL